MEKATTAQVVHDMTLAKHIDVEVPSQTESRSRRVLNLLGDNSQQLVSGSGVRSTPGLPPLYHHHPNIGTRNSSAYVMLLESSPLNWSRTESVPLILTATMCYSSTTGVKVYRSGSGEERAKRKKRCG
jgi:hypothetical protein